MRAANAIAKYVWDNPTPDETEALAKRIDAETGLPELIEALQACIPYVEGAYECAFPNQYENEFVLGQARDVLARVDGKP
jgi:hypothetical protein